MSGEPSADPALPPVDNPEFCWTSTEGVRCPQRAVWEVIVQCGEGDAFPVSMCDDHLRGTDGPDGRGVCSAHGAPARIAAVLPLEA